jgi:DNA modification methylase
MAKTPMPRVYARVDKMTKEWRVQGFEACYTTKYGAAYLGNSLNILKNIPKDSTDLIMTSPPFALQRKKKYGNVNARDYPEWFIQFAQEFKRILKPKGSLVIHIGGSWMKGKPVKNIYQYELLVRMCKELGFYLAQDMYWFNRAKLPGPAQWVTVNRLRLKDSVDQIWWLSKTPNPRSDNRRVLKDYSDAMKELLTNNNYYKPNVTRPSEHRISAKFYNGHEGAIPPNIFEYSNTDSQSKYIRLCRIYGIRPNPARYPIKLPEFFIKFLTIPGDKVLDPFAGSNATGEAAEKLNRRWISIEMDLAYLRGSMFRFFDESKLESHYGFRKNDR